jgi:hypothetical protein
VANDRHPARPPQVTLAGLAVIVGSLVLLISAFEQVSTLHSLDTRRSIEQLIGDQPSGLGFGVEDWLRLLKVAGMIAGASAAAAAILGWQALQRSRAARIVLIVIAVPLVLAGLAIGPFSALLVAVAVIMLWLPAANAWFDGRPDARMASMSEAPPPPGPSEPSSSEQAGTSAPSGQPSPPPPYGAPYGQPGYSQHPGYGAAPQQPGYPAYGAAASVPDRRPGTVTAAAVITIVLSSLSILGGVLIAVVGATMAQDMEDELDKRGYDTGGITTHEFVVGLSVLGVVMALVSLAALIAAIFVLRRSAAARIVLTVMSALCIAVSLVGIASGGSVVTLVGAIVVIVLLYRRPSNAWFAAGRQQPTPPSYPPTWPQG